VHPRIEGARGREVVDETAGVARETARVGADGRARIVEGDLDVEAAGGDGDAPGEGRQLRGDRGSPTAHREA